MPNFPGFTTEQIEAFIATAVGVKSVTLVESDPVFVACCDISFTGTLAMAAVFKDSTGAMKACLLPIGVGILTEAA